MTDQQAICPGDAVEQIRVMEKYRECYAWCLPSVKKPSVETRTLAQTFSRWFAFSDWDDPVAAWEDWWVRTISG